MKQRLIPAVMSGGSGTRLWPLSTDHTPKQFHALGSEQTLIQESVRRLVAIGDLPHTVTTTVPLAQLFASGPQTYTVPRTDSLTDIQGDLVTGSETMTMTILRVHADGSPYQG